jgi:beta-glucosidase
MPMQSNLTSLHHTAQDSFLWGVSTSGYQSEGGYNGSEQPQNNWSWSEHRGEVTPTKSAAEFWLRYEEDFQRCRELGVNAFRLSIEWARVQPSTQAKSTAAPKFDQAALDGYGDRIAACRRYGLEPIVTLQHFTHPAWLGLDAWLSADTIDAYINYVQVAVTQINRRLVDHHHLPPIRWYITVNEPNILIPTTYLTGGFPGSSRGIASTLRAYNNILSAHVRAYNCIHDLYEAEGWERPNVSLNTYCSDLYWSEKVIWDLLSFQERQIKPKDLKEYVYTNATTLDKELRAATLPFNRDIPYQIGRLLHWTSNWIGHRMFSVDRCEELLHELEASPRSSVFDFVAIDYYDPFLAHALRFPSFFDLELGTHDFRAWLMSGITSKWWDWRSLPEGLHFFCKFYSQEFNRPVLIAENGMALRRTLDNQVAAQRPDRLRRSDFLEAHIHQVQRLIEEQVPLIGYCHWSLMDNYEWGSYTPRFGLYTIDFNHSTDRLVEDHLGDRAAETYARLIREIRAKQKVS